MLPASASWPAVTGEGGQGPPCVWRPRAGRCGGDGLRPLGADPRPRHWTPPHCVGADRDAGLLHALPRLAHFQPEPGGRHCRAGIGLGLLRRDSPLLGDRQLPSRGGDGRRAALHPAFARGFLEYSQLRGFIADATRARHPNVREQARRWCCDVACACLRIPGTARRKLLTAVYSSDGVFTTVGFDGPLTVPSSLIALTR